MAEVSAEARIEATPGALWSRLTDFTAYAQWNAMHTSFPNGGPGTLAVGSTYRENMKLMGFPAEVDWTVEELTENRLFAVRGKGPMGVSLAMRYSLTPADAGATLARIDGEFTGSAVSLMAAKLKTSATTALTDSLHNLSRLAT
jgi:hypothetical protein